jgi:CubicO group peptidase (beta-lactamase class C family)
MVALFLSLAFGGRDTYNLLEQHSTKDVVAMIPWNKRIVWVLCLGGLVVLVLLVMPSGISREARDGTLEDIEREIERTMAQYDIPGVQLAWITDGLVEHRTFGLRDAEQDDVMDEDVVFRAQSLSKTLTAVLVLHLVETGELALTDTLDDVLPEAFLQEIPSEYREVSIHAILTHEARMPLGDFNRMIPIDETEILSLEEALILDLNQGPTRAGFLYSNVGYNLLEYVINQVTSEGFEALARSLVFDPLGMEDTTFSYDEVDRDRLAVGTNAFGRTVAHYRYPELGSGGLLTTASDWATFVLALWDGSILSTESLNELTTYDASVSLGSYGAAFDGYGYGLFLETKGDETFVAHGGQGYGFMAFFHYHPATGSGYVVMTNSQRTYPLIASLSVLLYDQDDAGYPGIGNIHRLMVGLEIAIAFWMMGLVWLITRIVWGRWLDRSWMIALVGVLALGILGFAIYFWKGNYLFLHVLVPIHFETMMGVLALGAGLMLAWSAVSIWHKRLRNLQGR